MLSQQNRLKRADDIAKVFRQGTGFHSSFFSAKYSQRLGGEPTRLAFSLGKKHVPKAVDRNRIKRMIIGELQKVPDFFTIGVDVVFFLTKSVSSQERQNLKESIKSFLKSVQQRR